MSSTGTRKPVRRTRKQVQAENSIAYWVGELVAAETGDAAKNQMWSWTLGSLADVERRSPKAAEAARYHLARILALFCAQLPEANIPLRAGLTEAEEARLYDPWGTPQGGVS